MPRRLIALLALATPAAAAPATANRAALEHWLASTDQELPMKLPRFASAKCGQPIDHATLHQRFYSAMFARELGIEVWVVGDSMPPPLVRGDAVIGDIVHHLLWNKESFTREGRNDYSKSPYRDQLDLELDTRQVLPGTVEAIAAPPHDQLAPDALWWIGGVPLRLMRSGAVLRGAKLYAQQVYGWTPCTFVDSDGHSFTDGAMYRIADIPAAWAGKKQQRLELVKLEINGGAGGPSSASVITAVSPEKVDVQHIVDAAHAKLAARLSSEDTAITDLLATQQRAATARAVAPKDAQSGPKNDRSPEPGHTDVQYRWDPVKRELTIVLAHWRGMRWRQSYVVPTRRVCPPGAKCAYHGPTDDELIDLDYGVELASIYTYSADGKLVAARDLPLRALGTVPSP